MADPNEVPVCEKHGLQPKFKIWSSTTDKIVWECQACTIERLGAELQAEREKNERLSAESLAESEGADLLLTVPYKGQPETFRVSKDYLDRLSAEITRLRSKEQAKRRRLKRLSALLPACPERQTATTTRPPEVCLPWSLIERLATELEGSE